MYRINEDAFNEMDSPADVLPLEEFDMSGHVVQLTTPKYDYVPPDHVDLILSNMGAHNPSYIYRLLSEYYHPEDDNIFNDIYS